MVPQWTGGNTSFFTGAPGKAINLAVSTLNRNYGAGEVGEPSQLWREKGSKQARKNQPGPDVSRWRENMESRQPQSKG